MSKFFRSKWFVAITTIISLALSIVAGWGSGYVPIAYGKPGVINGGVATHLEFSFKVAAGHWAIGFAVTVLVFVACVAVRKLYLNKAENDCNNKTLSEN